MIHPSYFFAMGLDIPCIAAGIETGIRIKNFMIGACFRDANSVIFSGNRGEIEYDKQGFVVGFALVTYYRLINIMAIDPVESLMTKVMLI